MKIYALGIDLGKTVFHLVGLDESGQVVIRKRCSRTQLLTFTANVQVQSIGMETCSGAHFLGKAQRAQGHEVRLMPAQYVKPYVQSNKSDYIDQAPGLRIWLTQLLACKQQNVVVVALANKLVRIAWAVLSKNERYRAPVLAVST